MIKQVRLVVFNAIPNMFLVGPMGAGKTTVGRRLAQMLRRDFLDSDQEIEQCAGAEIPLIFELEGEAGFRAREKTMIAELTQRPALVLATGGGAVLDPDNRRCLSRRGFVAVSYTHLDVYKRQAISRTSRITLPGF